jgi:hypothetical protein
MLPFSDAQFIQVFAVYNEAIWPAQVIAYVLAAGMLVALARGASRLVTAGLGLMWLWTGIAYHWLHFTGINNAAWVFGALFVLQGLLLVWAGLSSRLRFGSGEGLAGVLAWSFIAYAAILYPALGVLTGHGYPRLPMFGVTPCPVVIYTFGLLLLARPTVPWWLLAIPVAWSLVGGSAAFLLQIPQDWLLLLSGLAALPIAMKAHRRGAVAVAQ